MSSRQPLVTVVRVGLINYSTGLRLQQHLSRQPLDDVQKFRNYLVIQEHEPVYTVGIRNKDYTAEDEKRLKELGAEFYRTNRGGLITFHGPGQLVAYPIVHLRQFRPSMRWYVASLEDAVIDTCKMMGVPNATRTQDTGIWVGDDKICAIGVHGSRYITTHGIGLNCCTDLTWFENIVPCGIIGKGVTSLSEQLKRHVSVEEAAESFIKGFANIFKCDIEESQIEPTEWSEKVKI